MKKIFIGNDPARSLMGTIFLVTYMILVLTYDEMLVFTYTSGNLRARLWYLRKYCWNLRACWYLLDAGIS